MIWLLHKDPKLCAKYHSDEALKDAVIEAGNALFFGRGKWGKWAYKRSQNWLWLFKLCNALLHEWLNREGVSTNLELYKQAIDNLWEAIPNLPCSPRGLKSKFPSYDNGRTKTTKATIHQYRKAFNETQPNAHWSDPAEEPFWYYGNID